jgi:hypothetical protein
MLILAQMEHAYVTALIIGMEMRVLSVTIHVKPVYLPVHVHHALSIQIYYQIALVNVKILFIGVEQIALHAILYALVVHQQILALHV